MSTDPFLNRIDFERLRRIFEQALELHEEDRDAFLDRACGSSAALRVEVEGMLRSHEAEVFLDPPPLRLGENLLQEMSREDLIGVRVGDYVIESLIASGGMGHVYSAKRTDGRFELEVAMKVLKRGMDTEEILRRFQLEQQALAKLNHPAISRLLDAGTMADGRPYFVMERVYGMPITSYCDQHRLSIGKRLELFAAVCEGVQYAHQRLIVHRDLKPSNILVTDQGSPKLLDFGIAKLLSPDSQFSTTDISQTPRHPMTVAYASPEQLANEPITTATDVFSMGVLLYEILTGRRPFGSIRPGNQEHIQAVLSLDPMKPSKAVEVTESCFLTDGSSPVAVSPRSVSGARGASIGTIRRELRGDLDNISLTALRHDPRQRYSSVEQLATDVHRYRRGHPILARKDTMGYRTSKFLMRNKVAVSIGVTFSLSLLVGTALSVAGFRRARSGEDAAMVAATERARVLEFVESMFDWEIHRKLPSQITLEEVLISTISRLESEPLGDEVTRARLEATVARICARNRLNDEADRLFSKALETQERLVGVDSLYVGNTCHCIAIQHRVVGRLESAEVYARRAVDIYRRHGLTSDLVAVLTELGTTLSLLSRQDEAITVLEEAVQLCREAASIDPSLSVHALNSLALAELAIGDMARSERRFAEALAHSEGREGGFGVLLNNMAKLRFMETKTVEAEELITRALEIQRRLFSYPHEDLAMSHNNLALIALARGDSKKAEASVREALSIYRDVFGECHATVAGALFNLGKILRKRGDTRGSREAYVDALRMYRAIDGNANPNVVRLREIIAELDAVLEEE